MCKYLNICGFVCSAFNQFPDRGPAVAPNANKNTSEGLFVSAAAEQPAVEWYSGHYEPRAQYQRDQTTRGVIKQLELMPQHNEMRSFAWCNSSLTSFNFYLKLRTHDWALITRFKLVVMYLNTFLKSFQLPNYRTTLVVKQEVNWYMRPCSLFQCQNFLWKTLALPHSSS